MNKKRDIRDRNCKVIDRILFFIYAFCYLAFFQKDQIWFVHQLINDGNLEFRPYILAIFFTLAVCLVEFLFSRLHLFSGAWETCDFLPSALLLGAATSYNDSFFVGYSTGSWMMIIGISVALLLICRFLSARILISSTDNAGYFSISSLILLIVLLVPVFVGNTDNTAHSEHTMMYYFDNAEYDKVTGIRNSKRPDSDVMLRLRQASADSLSVSSGRY